VRPSCDPNPCVNDGTCVELASAPYYRCVCRQLGDISLPLGAHCEPLSACDTMPCPEHATCVIVDERRRDYRCVCHGDDDHCAHSTGAVTSLRPRDLLGAYSYLLTLTII